MRKKMLHLLWIGLILFLAYWSKIILWDIPALEYFHPSTTAFMKAGGSAQDLSWKPLEQIPLFMRQAIVAGEDENFYEHHGIDYEALKKAWKFNSKKKKYAHGGSTITMQLAKNLYLSANKNFLRKSIEVLLASRLEQALSKEKILETYLNVIEFGDHIYGAENAAQHYFHKPLETLNQRELVFLVAIIPSPKKWGHLPPGNYVQHRMGLITARVVGGAKSAPVPHEPEEEEEVITPKTKQEPVSDLAVESSPESEETLETPAEEETAPVVELTPEKKEFKTIEGE